MWKVDIPLNTKEGDLWQECCVLDEKFEQVGQVSIDNMSWSLKKAIDMLRQQLARIGIGDPVCRGIQQCWADSSFTRDDHSAP
jgi:hypothetical protein